MVRSYSVQSSCSSVLLFVETMRIIANVIPNSNQALIHNKTQSHQAIYTYCLLSIRCRSERNCRLLSRAQGKSH